MCDKCTWCSQPLVVRHSLSYSLINCCLQMHQVRDMVRVELVQNLRHWKNSTPQSVQSHGEGLLQLIIIFLEFYILRRPSNLPLPSPPLTGLVPDQTFGHYTIQPAYSESRGKKLDTTRWQTTSHHAAYWSWPQAMAPISRL